MTWPRELLLIGAGGFGRETVEAIRAGQDGSAWRLLGFLDDDPALVGTERDGTPVIGSVASVGDYPNSMIVVCTGSPSNFRSRKRIVQGLGLAPNRYATVIHPTASIGRSVTLGEGTVLLASVIATAAVEIGAHVAVMPCSVLTHDDVIEDYATIAAGVCLGGGVTVGEGAYLGSGALVHEGVRIGCGALVGMGAVVLDDVPPGEVWAGVPARPIRRSEVEG